MLSSVVGTHEQYVHNFSMTGHFYMKHFMQVNNPSSTPVKQEILVFQKLIDSSGFHLIFRRFDLFSLYLRQSLTLKYVTPT